jgi:hypothetical protein
MLSVDREVLRHQQVRADFDLGLVLDIDGRIAGHPRSHEQRNIVAPRHERPLEQPAARRAAARPRPMKLWKPSGSPVSNAIQRGMSTPPNTQVVLMQ